MAEVIIPGTYITVRDEGLISAGAVAAGNIGIVGTAAKGPVDEVCILGSFSEARELFGDADPWPLTMDSQKHPLTLVRALQLIYNNGGRTVYAVRTACQDVPKAATYVVQGTPQPAVTLTAKTPGTAGNAMTIKITDAPAPDAGKKAIQLKSDDVTEDYVVADAADFATQVHEKLSTLVTVETSGNSQKSSEWTNTPAAGNRFQGGAAGASPKAATYVIQGQAPVVTLTAKTPGTWGNAITVKVAKAPESDKKAIELVCGVVKEGYVVDDAQDLATQVKKKSHLVVAGTPTSVAKRSTWSATSNQGIPFRRGTNGEAATPGDYAASLAKLEGELINIVVLAGQDATMKASLDAHLKITEEIKRERIGIIGSNGTSVPSAITQVTAELDSPRIIYTAPGLKASTTDPDTDQVVQVTLPGAYTAAAVAGLISSLPVQTSPTNKTLTIEGLSAEFSASQLENLVTNRVLAVEKRNGYRIVKGITTATNSAWHQITTRRIVDYALYGVRSACDPYIGKLNNTRVRGAMKATLDAFLTRMVDSEALVGYKVDVSATRAQEIAGQAIVTMTIQPTFSIDYIMVTMYLG
ncbi:MAG TPA: phage tail sheath C-terminal domain-containing protein [Candidatus Saccharimonadia bacterium]|nr:phage tail sheath C-terminal domain-containing protein [Candidatus Saccharimonadia bacterium]